MRVQVQARVAAKRPELSDEVVIAAFENEPGGWLTFHAAPATETTLREVGLK